MRIYFCSQKRIIEYNNRVIINNKRNGQWIKVTRECYDILNQAVERGWTREKLLQELYDEEDRNYIGNILDKMIEMEIIYIDLKELESRVFDSITISINSGCNLKCKHCYIGAEITCEQVSFEIIKSRLQKVIDCKPLSIVLTGGEPLLYKNFKKVVEYIKNKYSGNLCLLTNGTLIDESNVFFIVRNFEQIDISLDGYDEKTCAELRGEGVFERVHRAVRLLKENGMKKIKISMTVTKYTEGHEAEFTHLCNTWEVEGRLRRFAPVGRGEENEEELFHIEQEFYDNRVCEFEQGLTSSKQSELYITVCAALEREIYVGSDGYLYPCGALNLDEFKIEQIDTIKDLNFYMENKIYLNTNGYKKFLSIQPENFSPCCKCSVSLFCTGCPVYVYLYKQRGYLEKYCNNRKKSNQNFIWG